MPRLETESGDAHTNRGRSDNRSERDFLVRGERRFRIRSSDLIPIDADKRKKDKHAFFSQIRQILGTIAERSPDCRLPSGRNE
jgi:hypothetical protein